MDDDGSDDADSSVPSTEEHRTVVLALVRIRPGLCCSHEASCPRLIVGTQEDAATRARADATPRIVTDDRILWWLHTLAFATTGRCWWYANDRAIGSVTDS